MRDLIVFAALQYNDPDPYIWMPIYLYSSFLCYKASQKHFYRQGYIIGLVVYGLYAAYLFFDKTGVLDWVREHNSESMVQTMKATKPWIEESREFFGLVILMVIIAINWLYMKRVRQKDDA
ncbi:transmembrane 220 family protein [Mucilaginibacter sp.]|uniref:transmembrane 220 family protein n=1 Tax=Mucilaginibacter sp. TaxID=1882438 RepID=UPI0035BC6841